MALTAEEAERLRKAGAGRFFRAAEGAAEGKAQPLQPAPGGGFTIRKRPDGTCGFLSREGRCRIHEELGAARKPLACQVFPLRFGRSEGAPVSLSLSCPAVVRNEGEPLAGQASEIARLRQEWRRVHPEPYAPLRIAGGRETTPEVAEALRSALGAVLERPGPGGTPPDLRSNVLRMAQLVEDLTRHRVLRLEPDRLAEYVALTGSHAARTGQSPGPRAAPPLARLFLRGTLLLAASARLRAEGARGWRRQLLGAALHLHGLGPPRAGLDRRAAARASLDLSREDLAGIVHRALRSTVATLGSSRLPLVTELGRGVAVVNVAEVLARTRAGTAGRSQVEVPALVDGLCEAADLLSVAPESAAGRMLSSFAADAGPLLVFARGA